ncbi:MAG: peptidoglycan-binding protein [candidate division Zixibacteria bacterium]|nr:peptidoglycan-binding protein [candidate division Zixibacteria bacterium]
MPTVHKVKQGECLASIAKKYGFSDWKKIYDHPENKDFKQKRPNSNIILPGDKLFIPEKELKEESVQTQTRHRFQFKNQKAAVKIVLKDEEGQAISWKKYKLAVEDIEFEGVTGSDGLIEHRVPADAENGKLTLWPKDDSPEESFTWLLKLGHLDPLKEISGVQARLHNLGFNPGPVDGISGPRTQAAVRAFQEKFGLTVDGIAGPETQAKLRNVHGC